MAVMDEQDYEAEIGRRLRAVRQQQDRTLDEVETCSGGRLTGTAVGSWERADRSISAAKLLEVADLYGVPADHLIPIRVGRHQERPIPQPGPGQTR